MSQNRWVTRHCFAHETPGRTRAEERASRFRGCRRLLHNRDASPATHAKRRANDPFWNVPFGALTLAPNHATSVAQTCARTKLTPLMGIETPRASVTTQETGLDDAKRTRYYRRRSDTMSSQSRGRHVHRTGVYPNGQTRIDITMFVSVHYRCWFFTEVSHEHRYLDCHRYGLVHLARLRSHTARHTSNQLDSDAQVRTVRRTARH